MLSIEGVITILQFSLFLGPVLAYFVTKRICLALQKKDRQIVLHGYESGRIVRLPGGEYIEVHEPVDEFERWRLVTFNDYEPLMIRPNAAGRIPVTERARAAMSRWFFEDRIEPVTLDGARGRASSLIGRTPAGGRRSYECRPPRRPADPRCSRC